MKNLWVDLELEANGAYNIIYLKRRLKYRTSVYQSHAEQEETCFKSLLSYHCINSQSSLR